MAIELSWIGEPREVDTLYFGGGTPTYLGPRELERLGQIALRWHPLAPDYEWTVEANPADLDRDRLEVLAQLGVNRISLGVQSFRSAKLRQLERDHRLPEILLAIELARDAKMRISVDLIFAAPGETLSQWQADLNMALRLEPDHLSTYGLTYEKGTTFWNRLRRKELVSVPEELEREMYLNALDQLTAAGFNHYDISNFARPGQRSRHNEIYWSGEGYFAAGPGAARYVDGIRETNHRSTSTYLKRIRTGQSPVAEREQLDARQRAGERLVFGLRRLEGVEYRTFFERTGFEMDEIAGQEIARLVGLGMLENDGRRVRLTRDGLLVSDSLWPELL